MLGLFIASALTVDAVGATVLAYQDHMEKNKPFADCLKDAAVEVAYINGNNMGPLLAAAACVEAIKGPKR